MPKYTISITIHSINKKILELYCLFLKKIFKTLEIKINFINIPSRTQKISLLKSPHVYKKAFEHFNLKKYKKICFIKNCKNLQQKSIIFALMQNKVKNLKTKIKIFQ